MPIVIHELAATIQPRPETVVTDRAPRPAGGSEAMSEKALAALRQAEEREARLAID